MWSLFVVICVIYSIYAESFTKAAKHNGCIQPADEGSKLETWQSKIENKQSDDIVIKSGEHILVHNYSSPHLFDSIVIQDGGSLIMDIDADRIQIFVKHLQIGTLQIGFNDRCKLFRNINITTDKYTKNDSVSPLVMDNNNIWIPFAKKTVNSKSQFIDLSYDIYGANLEQQLIIVNDNNNVDLFNIRHTKSSHSFEMDSSDFFIYGDIASMYPLPHANHIGLIFDKDKLFHSKVITIPSRRRLPGIKDKKAKDKKAKDTKGATKGATKGKAHDKRRGSTAPQPITAKSKLKTKAIPKKRKSAPVGGLKEIQALTKIRFMEYDQGLKRIRKDTHDEIAAFVKKMSQTQINTLDVYEKVMSDKSTFIPKIKVSKSMDKIDAMKKATVARKGTSSGPGGSSKAVEQPVHIVPLLTFAKDSLIRDQQEIIAKVAKTGQKSLDKTKKKKVKKRRQSAPGILTKGITPKFETDSDDYYDSHGQNSQIQQKLSIEKQMKQIRDKWNHLSKLMFMDYDNNPYQLISGSRHIEVGYNTWDAGNTGKLKNSLGRTGKMASHAVSMGLAVANLNPVSMTLRSGQLINDAATIALHYNKDLDPDWDPKVTAAGVLKKWMLQKLGKKEKAKIWKPKWWTKVFGKMVPLKAKGKITTKEAIWNGVKQSTIEVVKKAIIPAVGMTVTLTFFPPAAGAFAVASACALVTWAVARGVIRGVYLTVNEWKADAMINEIMGGQVAVLGGVEFNLKELPTEYAKKVIYMMQFPNSFTKADPVSLGPGYTQYLSAAGTPAQLIRENRLLDFDIKKEDLYGDYDEFEGYNGYYEHDASSYSIDVQSGEQYDHDFSSRGEFIPNNKYYYKQSNGYTNNYIAQNELRMYTSLLLGAFILISVFMVVCVVFCCVASLIVSRYFTKYFVLENKRAEQYVGVEVTEVADDDSI